MAAVLKNLGDHSRAKLFFEKALISDEKNFGKEHPTTATRYSNLAMVLQDLGDYSGAKLLLENALEILKINFPEGHPKIDIVTKNLQGVNAELDRE